MQIVKALGFILAIVVVSPAVAQVTAPPSGQTANIDPTRLELAHQVIEATGGLKTYEAQVDAMYSVMRDKMVEGMTPEVKQTFNASQDIMNQQILSMLPKIMDVSERIWATDFSEAELRDLLTFYRSSTGQSMMKKMPLVMQQSMVELVPVIRSEIPKIMHSVAKDICDRNACTVEQRRSLEAAIDRGIVKSGA